MIIPELYGGLGNNLFQIAAAYALAKEANSFIGINYKKHCNPCFFHPTKYKNNIFKNIVSTDLTFSETYNEPTFTYSKIPVKNNILLNGYFQSYNYFKKYHNEVKKLFSFPRLRKGRIDRAIANIDGQFIINHIRRGDYKDNNVYSFISKDYYKQAQDYIQSKTKTKLTNILVTDDKEAVRKEFDNDLIIETRDEIEDLYLLTRGKYFVGCNSTFSWWGSFLGNHKIDIFPKKWFNKGGELLKSKDIYRDSLLCI